MSNKNDPNKVSLSYCPETSYGHLGQTLTSPPIYSGSCTGEGINLPLGSTFYPQPVTYYYWGLQKEAKLKLPLGKGRSVELYGDLPETGEEFDHLIELLQVMKRQQTQKTKK